MASSGLRLIAITDVARFGVGRTLDAFGWLCSNAAPGTVCVQLRLDAPAKQWFALGSRLLVVCAETEQALCVGERLDVALALGVDHLHLKGGSIAAADARRLWAARGRSPWISRAWHPSDEVVPASVDALLVSPVAAQRKGRLPIGMAGLRGCLGDTGPAAVFALGGIGPREAEQALGSGARGVAAIGACYDQGRELLQALGIFRCSGLNLPAV